MTRVVRARYDGKVLVPEEPVDLRVGEVVTLALSSGPSSEQMAPNERREALRQALATAGRGPSLGDDALGRDSLYDDEHRAGTA